MFYFTPLPGFFSPFPHGTSALSVIQEYLALRGGLVGTHKEGHGCTGTLSREVWIVLVASSYHRLLLCSFFFGSLSQVIGNYPNLFEGGDEPIETGSVSPLAWLELVDKIVKGDRTKWDTILQMPLIEFLNTIAFYKAKTKERQKRLEQSATKGFNAYVVACLNEML